MSIIRKEVLIDAPVAAVWKHVTDPAKIAGWLMPNTFEARLGKSFDLACGTEGKISCTVLEIVPEQKLVYSWTSPHIGVETTVTITLTAEKNRTRVVLVHSGWDALPPSDRTIADPFDQGWNDHLRILQEQVESHQ
ncbi:MAG TPA: SRPBCC domain-containing protein [Planctomycetota bacterium]|nr:SRPBCC domain-containing protein [Planctomycetota bacterium]